MTTKSEKKTIVAAFLRRCNTYAEQRIGMYRERQEDAGARQALELENRILHWRAYLAFNEYTLEELRGTELDDWFDEHTPESTT